MIVAASDLKVQTLGPCRIESPIAPILADRRSSLHCVDEDDIVLFDDTRTTALSHSTSVSELPGFEPAGPRKHIYFDPAKTRVGIVTCGGLCPGLNDVIRAVVLELTAHYGVDRIFGFRNGYQGFIPRYGHDVAELTPSVVDDIAEHGGTILGSSRGQQDPDEVVDCLDAMSINILFVIGGDGSMRGAMDIARVIRERGREIAVVCIPKTIDNDIPFIERSFGFQTAFTKAAEAIRVAHVEATSAPNGVGVVQVMGRHSGFIACYAALANSDADVVLVPEVPFVLDGERGLLPYLHGKVIADGNAVVVVAEGAGQDLLADQPHGTDASGNVKLHDIGPYLCQRMADYFAAHGTDLSIKYIDPSYMIRGVPANPYDSVYCIRLAHAAVHAAMAGRTEVVVGRWHRRFVHVPIGLAVSHRNQIDPGSDLWLALLEATGQPAQFN